MSAPGAYRGVAEQCHREGHSWTVLTHDGQPRRDLRGRVLQRCRRCFWKRWLDVDMRVWAAWKGEEEFGA